jgi:hypothetical protein
MQQKEPGQEQSGVALSPDPQVKIGTWIRRGQYLIEALRECRRWDSGLQETIWSGQDKSGYNKVAITDIVLPKGSSVTQQVYSQAILRRLFRATNSSVPKLISCFSEHGHLFFVLSVPPGVSLLTQMEQAGGRLPQKQVVQCCLQISEMLEELWQGEFPFLHGAIAPQNIWWTGTRWILIHFSLVAASGCFPSLGAQNGPNPYEPPEFRQGQIRTPQQDLYALLACAYHALTGALPVDGNRAAQRSQLFRVGVSESFVAILLQGLHPVAAQRFQNPRQLKKPLDAEQEVFTQQPMEVTAMRADTNARNMPYTNLQTEMSILSSARPVSGMTTLERHDKRIERADAELHLHYETKQFGDKLVPLIEVMLLFLLFLLIASFGSY